VQGRTWLPIAIGTVPDIPKFYADTYICIGIFLSQQSIIGKLYWITIPSNRFEKVGEATNFGEIIIYYSSIKGKSAKSETYVLKSRPEHSTLPAEYEKYKFNLPSCSLLILLFSQ